MKLKIYTDGACSGNPGKGGWAAIILGAIGVMIILDPIYSEIKYGHLYVLLSASLWSIALIIIKILGRTENSVTTTSYMIILMIPLSGIAAYFKWTSPSLYEIIILLFIGVLGTLAQMLLAESLKKSDTSVIMPFDFLKFIWAAILGFFFFSEI